MTLIVALGLGPSLILVALGRYDAAFVAFLLSLGAGFFIIYVLDRLDTLDLLLNAFATSRQKRLLLAFLLIDLGFLLFEINWKRLFSFF